LEIGIVWNVFFKKLMLFGMLLFLVALLLLIEEIKKPKLSLENNYLIKSVYFEFNTIMIMYLSRLANETEIFSKIA